MLQATIYWRNREKYFYRICEHLGYIRTRKHEKAKGHHFNLPGRSLAKLTATILEEVKVNDPEYRKKKRSTISIDFISFQSIGPL